MGTLNKLLGEIPALLDIAIWWYRFTDLEAYFGGGQPTPEQLCRGFIDDFQLTDVEISALFITLDTIQLQRVASLDETSKRGN
jgi:hypothetical protein